MINVASAAPRSEIIEIGLVDTVVNVAGFASAATGGVFSFMLEMVSVTCYVLLLQKIWKSVSRGMQSNSGAVLPPETLNFMRWEIVISWSIFPAIDIARRYFGLPYETSEAFICTNDALAKVPASCEDMKCN